MASWASDSSAGGIRHPSSAMPAAQGSSDRARRSALQGRFEKFVTGWFVIDQLTVVEFEDAIREVEVAIVMRDHQHALSAGFQFGQQLGVEDFLEMRVLIRSPLVEEVEGAVLQVRGQQREALSLALGEVDGG